MDEAAPMLQHSGRLDDAAAVHGNDLVAIESERERRGLERGSRPGPPHGDARLDCPSSWLAASTNWNSEARWL